MSDAATLVRRLRSGSRLAQLQALRSLAGLTASSLGARQEAVAAGAVAVIVPLIRRSSGGAVQSAAAQTLRVLSLEADAATLSAFEEAGA